jgi:hypothetical protein
MKNQNIINEKIYETVQLNEVELFQIDGGKDWITSLGVAAGELWCEIKAAWREGVAANNAGSVPSAAPH